MSRLYNTFEFIGNIVTAKDKDKFHKKNESASGFVSHRLSFAIQESKTNSVFLELFGGYSKSKANKVFSYSKGTENKKGSNLEIPWDDRLNPETVDMVADFKKIVIDTNTDADLKNKMNQLRFEIRSLEYRDELTDSEKQKLNDLKKQLREQDINRKEFIHEYDAIQYLSEHLEKYKAHKFRVTGQIEYNAYNGRFYRKFKPETIEIVENDTPSQLRAKLDLFFTKDSVDKSDFKNEKKIYVNGYALSYDNNYKTDKFFPQQVVLDGSRLDFDNEKHANRFKYLENKLDVKGKGVYHLQWEVKLFRGADEVEFTYDDLTQEQKESVDLGFNKVDDYKPKDGVLGENVEETRLLKPNLQKVNDSNDFSNGATETSYEQEDLDYVFMESNNKPPVQNNTVENKEESKPVNISDELDDLF